MNLYFISDHEPIYKAFKKVVETLFEARVQRIVPGANCLDGTNVQDIIILEGNDQSIVNWLWSIVRVKYQALF